MRHLLLLYAFNVQLLYVNILSQICIILNTLKNFTTTVITQTQLLI